MGVLGGNLSVPSGFEAVVGGFLMNSRSTDQHGQLPNPLKFIEFR